MSALDEIRQDPRWEQLSDEERQELERIEQAHEETLEKLNKKLEAAGKRAEGLRSAYRRSLLENTFLPLLTRREIRGSAELLMPHIERRTNVDLTDLERPRIECLDADGRLLLDDEGDPASAYEMLRLMQRDPALRSAFRS